jgi:hypothetical protein
MTPTPEARELEARDKVTKARRDCEVLAVLDGGALLVMQIRFDTAMDAYRTAVRAALVAEMVDTIVDERATDHLQMDYKIRLIKRITEAPPTETEK